MAMVAGQSGGLGFWVPGAWSSQSVGGGGKGWGENYWCIWSTRIAVFMFAKWRHRSRRRRLRRARMAPSL